MMRSTLAILLGVIVLHTADAAAQAPNTDVYLAPIERIGDSIVVGTPVNVTRRPGYDNQPSFTLDSRSILYVAQADGQTDIWRYDIALRRSRRLTRTPESEYSPTPIPGERRFSAVRVERDSTQRLWSFNMAGTDARLLLRDLKPVGYHGWLDSRRLVAYVLGTPSTLHLINRDGSGDTIIARDVGRAIQPLPQGSNALFTFTQRDSAGRHRIFVYRGATVTTRYGRTVVTLRRDGVDAMASNTGITVDSAVKSREPPYELVASPADNEFHTRTPDNVLVSASASKLIRWNATLGAASAWLPVADLGQYGLRNVSRLAFSPDGNWLAFVAEPVEP